jgi:hypothetical protein
MSLVPTGYATPFSALYPQAGQGIYVGATPGSSNSPGAPYGGAGDILSESGLMIQTDKNIFAPISSLTAQPQNLFRLTTGFGNTYLQAGGPIIFTTPFSGGTSNSLTLQPSTGVLSISSELVSSLASKANPSQTINVDKLVSTVLGYGWA